MFDSYWSNEARPVLSEGFLPPLAGGFQRFVGADRVARAMRATLDQALAEAETGDTHPPLRERVAALERIPETGIPEGRPALALFTGLAARERDLMASILKPEFVRTLQPTSWEEVPERVYARRYEAMRERYGEVPRGDDRGGARVECWSCRAALPVTPETRGQKVACPQCGTPYPMARNLDLSGGPACAAVNARNP